MPRDNLFRDFIVEDVLGYIEGVTSKGMFGGHCIFLDGLAVGLIIDGELYLKADKNLVAQYKKEGLYPFTYKGNKNKVYEMSYVNVPIETLENREKMEERIYESFEISRRTKK